MLQFLFDPLFHWPFMALLLLAFLFAYVGARAVFHPDHFISAPFCFAAQVIALVTALSLWGYLGFRFGASAALITALTAWLACCAGSRRGGLPGPVDDVFNLRMNGDLARHGPDELA